MALLRALFFFCAKQNIHLQFFHVPGKQNVYADLLSRLQVEKFKRLHPDPDDVPTPLPGMVWDILFADESS